MPINDPIAWWRLDDGSGETAVDSSGNGYDLTLFNTPTWVAGGQIAGALNFDFGNSEKGETDAPSLLARLQAVSVFTVAFWARAPAYTTSFAAFAIRNGVDFTNALLVVYPYDNVNGNGARVFWNGGDVVDQNTGGAGVDEWHHFMFVSRSATDHELYVDNVSVGTSSTSKSLAGTLSHVTVGAWDGGQFYNGDLDDVRIYDRALNDAERADLFAFDGSEPEPEPEDIAITAGSLWNFRKRIEEDERERDERWEKRREQIEKISRLVDGVADKVPDDVPEAQPVRKAEKAVEKAAVKLVADVPLPAYDWSGLAAAVKQAERAARQAEAALARYAARKEHERKQRELEEDDEDVLLLMA